MYSVLTTLIDRLDNASALRENVIQWLVQYHHSQTCRHLEWHQWDSIPAIVSSLMYQVLSSEDVSGDSIP